MKIAWRIVQCRKLEADIAAGNAAAAEAAASATVQDDFADLGENDLAELDIKDRPENQVRVDTPCPMQAAPMPGKGPAG